MVSILDARSHFKAASLSLDYAVNLGMVSLLSSHTIYCKSR
jgi:hypothetical protein